MKTKQIHRPYSRITKSVLLCLFLNNSFLAPGIAIPFAKDKDKEEEAAITVPKVKLTKEQQSDFDSSLKNGNSHLSQNNFDLAQICFLRCAKIDPSSPEPHLGLAYCYAAKKKSDDAQSEVFQALALDPNSTRARFLLGDLMMADYRWDEAGGQYLQVLKVDPNDHGARGNLATCLQMMGQIDAAAGQYKYILEKDPKCWQAAFNLASAYQSKSMFDDAAQYYKKVVEIDPNNANAYCSLAKCLIAKKDYKAAQVLLDHVRTKISANNYFLHLMQGYLYETQGERRPAIEEYTKALALSPKDPDCQKSLQRMLESGSGKIGAKPLSGASRIGGLKVNTH